MAWRPAKSLVTLKNQLDSTYPGWLFLGYLGDQSHAAVASDHNPNAQGVVCALDIGPGGGLNIHALADNIVANPHPDLKYIISNRRIAEYPGYRWRAYSGVDPHDTHIHVSVGRGPDGQSRQPYDDTNEWSILKQGADMATNQQIDDWISKEYYIAFGQPAPPAVFDDWRKVLKNNFTDGSLSILAGIDTNAGALKNQPKGEFEPYSGKPLYTKKG